MKHSELTSQFVKTNLRRDLEGDATGDLRKRLDEQLDELVQTLERERRHGAEPDNYLQIQTLLTAGRVAQQIVRRTWSSLHRD